MDLNEQGFQMGLNDVRKTSDGMRTVDFPPDVNRSDTDQKSERASSPTRNTQQYSAVAP